MLQTMDRARTKLTFHILLCIVGKKKTIVRPTLFYSSKEVYVLKTTGSWTLWVALEKKENLLEKNYFSTNNILKETFLITRWRSTCDKQKLQLQFFYSKNIYLCRARGTKIIPDTGFVKKLIRHVPFAVINNCHPTMKGGKRRKGINLSRNESAASSEWLSIHKQTSQISSNREDINAASKDKWEMRAKRSEGRRKPLSQSSSECRVQIHPIYHDVFLHYSQPFIHWDRRTSRDGHRSFCS